MIVNRINEYLTTNGKDISQSLLDSLANDSKYIFERQFGVQEEKEPCLRLSSIGNCLRKQAYQLLNYPIKGKEIDSRAKMVFFMGDFVEMSVVHLAELAGCAITDQQKEVEINGVKGHIDGIHKGRLVEIKSMSSFAFTKFDKNREINESYVYQINAYMEALGLDETIYIALNKDACFLAQTTYKKDNRIVDDIYKRIEFLKKIGENLPEKPYSPNDKGYLPWQCLYCQYWGHCWPTSDKILSGKSYKLKV